MKGKWIFRLKCTLTTLFLILLVYVMANEGPRQNSSDDLLHQSYAESFDRISDAKNHINFTLPTKILKERVSFWDSFFTKYSSQMLDEVELDIATLQPCLKQSPFKSLQAVQFWVNTGYLPSGKERLYKHDDSLTPTDVSILEEESNSVHDYVEEKKLSPHDQKLGCIDSHSSNTVDTTTYIFSNMNVTNKAHAIPLMEGAGHSTLVSSHCKQNMDIMQDLVWCEGNDRAIVIHKHQNNYEHSTPKSFAMSECTSQQKNAHVGHRSTTKWSVSRISKEKNEGSPNESNFVNMQSLDHKGNSIQNIEMYDSIVKTGLRKKLYTVSDSPVDILDMKRNNKSIKIKNIEYLHPALDFGNGVKKKRKILKKHKSMVFRTLLIKDRRFSTLSHWNHKEKIKAGNLNSTCKTGNKQTKRNNNVSNNCSVMMNSLLGKSLIETDNILRQCKNKLSISSECEENHDKSICKKHNVSKTLKIPHPIVCLRKLSSVEIERYKKSKKFVTNQNHEMSNEINLGKAIPVVSLTRLRKIDVLKHKIPDASIHPVVCLKRLSVPEIQKYIKVPNTTTDNPSPKVRLKTLSNTNVSKKDMICNKTISVSSILATRSHQANHSMIISNNKISASKRKYDEEDRKHMNILSNKITNIKENMYSMTRRSNMISPEYNQSSKISLKDSKANKCILRNKNSYTDSTTSSSDITEITPVNSYNNINRNTTNNKSFILSISDDDDDFVEFIHCPEEVLQLQKKKYYKRLI